MGDSMNGSQEPFNARRHQQQTQERLILGGFLILVVVGGGLILVIYGPAAAVTGLACLGVGLGLFALLWGFLKLLDRWSRDEP
jgi:protein-S-isoprenylcysteine O-methyltransferase Ste14